MIKKPLNNKETAGLLSGRPTILLGILLLVFSVAYLQKAYVGYGLWISNSTMASLQSITDLTVPDEDVLPAKSPEIKLLFIGDMMFDRAIRKTVNSKGYDYVFGQSAEIFKNYDLVIGNLEGSITNFPTRTVRADGTTGNLPLDFTFATATAPALRDVGIDIVSLANNHSYNRGQIGLDQTKKYLTLAEVGFFGDPNNANNLSTIKCQNEICIGLVGYHEFAYKNDEKVLAEIKRLKPLVDVLVVMPHWGVEYKKNPSALQKQLAHQWIDAGADVIMGAHPHIIESIEEYRGRAIFYSLGNYIFDQTFSFDTTHGLAVGMNIVKNTVGTTSTISISYELKPVQNTTLSVTIPDDVTTQKIIKEIADISKAYISTSTREQILNRRAILFGSSTSSDPYQN